MSGLTSPAHPTPSKPSLPGNFVKEAVDGVAYRGGQGRACEQNDSTRSHSSPTTPKCRRPQLRPGPAPALGERGTWQGGLRSPHSSPALPIILQQCGWLGCCLPSPASWYTPLQPLPQVRGFFPGHPTATPRLADHSGFLPTWDCAAPKGSPRSARGWEPEPTKDTTTLRRSP